MADPSKQPHDAEFPCSLVIHTPFPTHRLADAAYQTLSVDPELSALVQRSFAVISPAASATGPSEAEKTVLQTTYRATTDRMLRVAVNSFFDSLGTVVQVMEELDTDVLHENGLESLEGVQGVEQGLTGSTLKGG